LLHSLGKINAWHRYRDAATQAAIRKWCEDNGLVLKEYLALPETTACKGRGLLTYTFPQRGADEMSVAPQEVLWPWKATGMPPIDTMGSPSTITHGECPLIGQLQGSPFRATAMPCTDAVPEAASTLPPWLVASPSRITFFMLSSNNHVIHPALPAYRSATQRHTVMPYADLKSTIVSPAA
jgi:hypothetical protein